MKKDQQNQLGQPQLHQSQQDFQDINFEPPWSIKAMFAYMYFIQGVVSAIPGTVPYIYPNLPDYLILSVFAFAEIPYSFKFITAPFIEKYFHVFYGKRKTWIIVSQLSTAILLFIGSFFTAPGYALIFAFFTVAFNFAMTLQDIALDGLCLKEMKNRSRMSVYQSVFQTIGITISGLAQLKLTSPEFAKDIGLGQAITELRWVIMAFSFLLIIPSLIIHFKFRQTFVSDEMLARDQSLLKVISIYRVYFFPSFRYFRTAIFLLFFYQGVNFFVAGYNYELINRGFSRNIMNTIDNINMIPQIIILLIFGTYSNFLGFKKSFIISLMLVQIVFIYLYFWFPTTTVPIAITSLVVGLLTAWIFMLVSILVASFPSTGFASMLYTMGASFSNAGRLVYIQVALLKIFPWKVWALVGIIYTFIVILVIPFAMKWINNGKADVTEFLTNQEQKSYQELEQEDQKAER